MAFGKKDKDGRTGGKGAGKDAGKGAESDSLPTIHSYTSITSEEQRRELHTTSTPLPTPAIRTVLVDVGTEMERGFWDEPLWLPVGAILEGGPDLWEIVSIRLYIPTVTPEQLRRPILYLYATRIEA
jgi:hypothetical protein